MADHHAMTLAALQGWIRATLAAAAGGGVAHEPLFRSFPDGIPDDTFDLWVRKVLATSSGDVRDAPPPDGGTELVDIDRARARDETSRRWWR